MRKMPTRVGVIDYGAGNVTNVARALEHLGVDNEVLCTGEYFSSFTHLILPGVGSFGYGMKGLEERSLISPTLAAVALGVPLLGICLGMQLLFDFSEEAPGVQGLGLIGGDVVRLRQDRFPTAFRVPHVGWAGVSALDVEPSEQSALESTFYFCHRYHCVPHNPASLTGFVDIEGTRISASVRVANVEGVQFHPEKSSTDGLRFLERWISISSFLRL